MRLILDGSEQAAFAKGIDEDFSLICQINGANQNSGRRGFGARAVRLCVMRKRQTQAPKYPLKPPPTAPRGFIFRLHGKTAGQQAAWGWEYTGAAGQPGYPAFKGKMEFEAI